MIDSFVRLLCAFFYRRNSVFVVVHLAIELFDVAFYAGYRIKFGVYTAPPLAVIRNFFIPSGQPPRKADKPAKHRNQ